MNSFDMFDTLVARRCVEPFGQETDPQMERESCELIPIRENILKVCPEDVIISDMYLPQEFLQKEFARVTGLKNEVIVGQFIKRTGVAWAILRGRNLVAQSHMDDSQYCLDSAKAAGITPIEARQADLTPNEKALRNDFPALALAMREARLGMYNEKFRNLELVQTQINFPILFLSSLILHSYAEAKGIDHILMSSRDCWLWSQIQHKVRDMLRGHYEITYFFTSRVAREVASPDYLKYVNGLLTAQSLIVDLVGTGRSLRALLNKTTYPLTRTLFITRNQPYDFFPPVEPPPQTILGIVNNNSNFEDANADYTPMTADVDDKLCPVSWDKSPIDWEKIAEVDVMHRAIGAVLFALDEYDWGKDLFASTNVIFSHLNRLYPQILGANEFSAIDQAKALEEVEILKVLRREQ